MKNIFVTVGSTSFDSLLDELFDNETLSLLSKLGCEKLTVQHGNYCDTGKLRRIKESWKKFELECFDYKPSIEQYLNSADFVIGHAGAGTVIETLRKHKPLLIVVNDSLMNNHQEELALEMSSLNYAFMTCPKQLRKALSNITCDNLVPFPDRQNDLFGNFMKELLINSSDK